MMDFAAFIEGLPEQQGGQRAEEELKAALERSTGQAVVNVSIAWDYSENQEFVVKALKRQLRARDLIPITPPRFDTGLDLNEPKTWNKWLEDVERQAFLEEAEQANETDDDIIDMLEKMKSSSNAIAVFETESMW